MPISEYMQDLRRQVGTTLLMIPAVVAVITDEDGRVLLQLRADDGRWGLPGGAIDPGEEPARAVVREVWEEVGVRVEPVALLGVFGGRRFRSTYPNGDQIEPVISVFRCRLTDGSTPADVCCPDGESLESRFFSPNDFPPNTIRYPRWLWETSASEGPARFQWEPHWAIGREEPAAGGGNGAGETPAWGLD